MKILLTAYSTVTGDIYSAYFMGLIGTAYDYQSDAVKNLSEWRKDQPVFAEIGGRITNIPGHVEFKQS